MQVQTTVCPICQAELNSKGECVGCLLRIGLGATDVPRVFGDFRLACHEDGSPWELGRGAMGVTYRATDQVLHRTVALKVVRTPDGMARSPAVHERFLREARGAASLRHPNVAEVFQFGTSPETDHAYYAMELIDGETLEERVRRDGPLPVALALEIAVQISRALVAAADRGLVHRDLKPGNVMIARGESPGTTRVVVIDFGLAKAMAEAENSIHLTEGGFIGTPAFASPEQFRGEPADARSDLYSLGVTLWYALAGHALFAGKTLDELRDHPARTALPLAQLTARKVPAPVMALLRSALAANPVARPASAREFLAALETCRRRRGGWHLATMGAAAVLVAAGISWWTHGPNRLASSQPVAVIDKSVAVLPFDNFSEGQNNAFFADGVQDAVLTDLAKLANLKVISRSSVMQYRDSKQRDVREIGRTLGVTYVVEGSVQCAGNKTRVTAQLIDARTDTHVWAEHYDRDLINVFTLQSEIAQAIAGQLKAAISPQEHAAMNEVPTHDEQAYQLYLRAVARKNDVGDFGSDAQRDEALDLLRQATALDPGFARAFALMTELEATIYLETNMPANGEVVRAYAETAARQRPGSVDANVAMAIYQYEVERDYGRAHDTFAAAVLQSPNDARAYYYLAQIERRQGRWTEAETHFRQATELDPENVFYFHWSCVFLCGMGRFAELCARTDRYMESHPKALWLHEKKAEFLLAWKADTLAARAELALVPPGSGTSQRVDCDCYERDFAAAERDLAACPPSGSDDWWRVMQTGDLARYRGDTQAAARAYTAARPLLEAVLRTESRDFDGLAHLAALDAHLDHRETALEEGRRALLQATAGDTEEVPDSLYHWAQVLTFANEREEAIRTLGTICGRPFGPTYGDLHSNPDWDPLRGDSRFEALVNSLAPKPSP